jgi:hypothetical protein
MRNNWMMDWYEGFLINEIKKSRNRKEMTNPSTGVSLEIRLSLMILFSIKNNSIMIASGSKYMDKKEAATVPPTNHISRSLNRIISYSEDLGFCGKDCGLSGRVFVFFFGLVPPIDP